LDLQKIKRDVLKEILNPCLKWTPLASPREGFSIVLGVPWALRHLLPANLEFVQRTDIQSLDRLYAVFDRPPQEGGDAFIEEMTRQFPRLPLDFSFHPRIAGGIVERINQSKFFASANWTQGIGKCRTQYAIMHDFDLYPLVPNYFTSMIEALRDRQLRFTGLELTDFDGLTGGHGLIGTWALGIDVQWLRGKYRPIDCFHAIEYIEGRRFDLDAFTHIESKTPERALVGSVTASDAAHVRNLCSTYLRFSKGQKFDVVWRLHLMWYLDFLCGRTNRLDQVVQVMAAASSGQIEIDGAVADFSDTHATCANVLRREVIPMERFLFGELRPEVARYAEAFERFLIKHGKSHSIHSPDGAVLWSLEN
jgi:hypothetical protein